MKSLKGFLIFLAILSVLIAFVIACHALGIDLSSVAGHG